MFQDQHGLLQRLLDIDPDWRREAITHIERTLADHDDWCRSGKPPREVWDVYKWLRDPKSHSAVTRDLALEKLTDLDIVDPCPMTTEAWAKANPIEAEQLAQATREFEANLRSIDAKDFEQRSKRVARVKQRQLELLRARAPSQ